MMKASAWVHSGEVYKVGSSLRGLVGGPPRHVELDPGCACAPCWLKCENDQHTFIYHLNIGTVWRLQSSAGSAAAALGRPK